MSSAVQRPLYDTCMQVPSSNDTPKAATVFSRCARGDFRNILRSIRQSFSTGVAPLDLSPRTEVSLIAATSDLKPRAAQPTPREKRDARHN
jgi:hypothetical protein